MAKLTNQQRLDRLMEEETTVRWDATDEPAILWTASVSVKNLWVSYGFPVLPQGGGWGTLVDRSRISYKPVSKQAQIRGKS